MTPEHLSLAELQAIRAKALSMAERTSGRRRTDLFHIAIDCLAAIDGCPASLDSVVSFIADEHELDLAMHEARACEQSTVGMAA